MPTHGLPNSLAKTERISTVDGSMTYAQRLYNGKSLEVPVPGFR